jgi:hypothetical protein
MNPFLAGFLGGLLAVVLIVFLLALVVRVTYQRIVTEALAIVLGAMTKKRL